MGWASNSAAKQTADRRRRSSASLFASSTFVNVLGSDDVQSHGTRKSRINPLDRIGTGNSRHRRLTAHSNESGVNHDDMR